MFLFEKPAFLPAGIRNLLCMLPRLTSPERSLALQANDPYALVTV